jgi:Cu+-exporting ATPase
MLSENNLCNYYDLSERPGLSPKSLEFSGKFAFLDDNSVVEKLIDYQDDHQVQVTFYLPQVHCSSCVWLLEHLYRLDSGIVQSRIHFHRKELNVTFQKDQTTLRKVVELLASVGYSPQLALEQLETKAESNPNRKRVYKIAVAGFCFGNIMMLSFPEYFHIASTGDVSMKNMFGYLNLILSLPVLLYSGSEFYISAWKGLKAKFLNIDLPLTLSIAITFGRSVYEIFTEQSIGYLDSMSGIIFFMLLGRFFQDKTFFTLQFDRNYKSYFPISVSVVNGAMETSIPLNELKEGQTIRIRSQELIPADSELQTQRAFIDYSFVTGESRTVEADKGSMVYAGGRNTGATMDLVVMKAVKQSYLTHLWDKDAFQEEKQHEEKSFIHKLARNFTILLLAISVGAFFYWLPTDFARGINALTTVLIVACPCALLLSVTFTHGAAMRVLSNNKFYLKNAFVLEKIARLNQVVFDKTGTITVSDHDDLAFVGNAPDAEEANLIFTLLHQSNHTLSRIICKRLSFCDVLPIDQFLELPGKGVQAMVNGKLVKAGSAEYVRAIKTSEEASQVYVSIEGKVLGYYRISNAYRTELSDVLSSFVRMETKLAVISGDRDSEKGNLQRLFPKETKLRFNQKPEDKMHFIQQLQSEGAVVAMIGDGLNDAGALQQSDVGISISENVNNFAPACDVIVEASSFELLPKLIQFARNTRIIILISFGISLLYNIIGVGLAIRGEMEPVLAAILMPISSFTIMLFTTGGTWFVAKKLGLSR